MSRTQKKIFLVRPTEPNRGDIMSRYGLLKQIRGQNDTDQIVVLSKRDVSELAGLATIVKPGPLKDLIPRWEQVSLYSKGDEVWWACGHDFQDDSSALKLPFLVVKFLFYRLMGLRVKIIAQGAGPLRTSFGKWCIRTIIKIVESASFRDKESLDLVAHLAPAYTEKFSLTVDQALFASDKNGSGAADKDIQKRFLLGVNLRRWFHFDGHWEPYEYRVRLGLMKTVPGNDKMNVILRRIAVVLDRKIDEHDISLLFIPMYPPKSEPWEDDFFLLKELKHLMQHKERVMIVSNDMSPNDLLTIFDELDAMIGVRLHSTIIATLLGKPSIHLSYSPKGQSYFKRIKQNDLCIPFETLLNERYVEHFADKIDEIVDTNADLSIKIVKSVKLMKEEFAQVL
ncbi:MAG: polysaccharide pyruvyl transferase family protein [Thermodesulfobacteriota bacterium]|nr:polysaccharide pyruvyl transferase family protein [Thermodesulfobacteriota bacterium]